MPDAATQTRRGKKIQLIQKTPTCVVKTWYEKNKDSLPNYWNGVLDEWERTNVSTTYEEHSSTVMLYHLHVDILYRLYSTDPPPSVLKDESSDDEEERVTIMRVRRCDGKPPTYEHEVVGDGQRIIKVWDEPTSKGICEEYTTVTHKNRKEKLAKYLKLEDIIIFWDYGRQTLWEVVKITDKSVMCKQARFIEYNWTDPCPYNQGDTHTYHKYDKKVNGWGEPCTVGNKTKRLPIKNEDNHFATYHYTKPIFIHHYSTDNMR